MIVLGIETSCDETAVAVIRNGSELLAEYVYSQVEHSDFGGIVPEIASRQQIRKIAPLFVACESEYPLSPDTIDGIAVTCGPGLIGSLLVGLSFAKALSYGWGLPFLGVNHIEGHIFANYVSSQPVEPPFLCLVVSGGHTMLIKVNDWCDYQVLGSTRDDAAGEAYDKVAKLLGVGYPGGEKIDKLACEVDRKFHAFPKARFKTGAYQFSFSGLKTAVALYLREKDQKFVERHLSDICASFQECVVEMLVSTSIKAALDLGLTRIAVGGGVAANSRLREVLQCEATKHDLRVFFPESGYCTDNAAMIAAAGCYRMERGERSDFSLTATPYLKLV